jgi:hypothetical protein
MRTRLLIFIGCVLLLFLLPSAVSAAVDPEAPPGWARMLIAGAGFVWLATGMRRPARASRRWIDHVE